MFDRRRSRCVSGALDANEYEIAVESYRGPFLPSFGVPGGVAFEQWADLERDRLQAGFKRGSELLVRRLLNQLRFTDARQWARRVRELTPDHEATGRLVLETFIASRDFVSASMEANALVQWAKTEGLVMESATRAAIARARRDDTSVDRDHGSTALVAELTGREREFSAITTAWGAVRTGPARHLHLSAPAGHGKTWLLSIWLRIPSGTRRLTTQLRDDVVGGWLPDGSALVGMTDRWSQQGSLGYDIALFDTATGIARQITRGTAHEGRPFVSPDGTRIIAGRVAHHEEANTRRWRASRDRAC